MILLVGGEKGGTGKSTIATTLAAMAGSRGREVVLIDADLQGTSTIWAEERTERGHESPHPLLCKTGRAFRRDVEDLTQPLRRCDHRRRRKGLPGAALRYDRL